MKRFLILFMALGLIVGSVATAEAGRVRPRRVERTVEGTYNGTWLPFGNRDCASTGGTGCVTVTAGAGESHLSAKVTDAHGQPVFVVVAEQVADAGPDEVPPIYGFFCGQTTRALKIRPGTTYELWVGYWNPWVPSCVPGLATTGTVRVTLSNLP